MPPPILATKLHLSPIRPGTVLRPHLIERLNEGLNRKLILVSAPAGFGKTTLISGWLTECVAQDPTTRVAWLSLDENDHDLTQFLTYLLAASQTIAPAIETKLLPLLESAQPVRTESLMTGLLNELALIPERAILILDDYHLTDNSQVDDAVTFLVAHLPSHVHLVITTREDPNLPLARLRARGHLAELRAKDLRFQPFEAAEFLNRAMGLSLTAEDVAALDERTEGWIAGLQLAALSLQGQPDRAAFIRAFAGDHRYIVDYLAEEVLERQPESVRGFLLQTSILDRLSGPLCEAVTGQRDASERLEALERGNFFVVPLDDKRKWYRYHHLFGDVLSAQLSAEQPDQVAVLHLRASAWYAQNDMPSDAIRHALAGKDFEQAAYFIELAVPAMRRTRQEATLLGWLRALPDELLRRWPVLSVHYAGTLLQIGQLEGVEHRLLDAERWLDTEASSPEPGIADREEFRLLPASIAMYRAASALILGAVPDTIRYAQQIRELVREDDDLPRGAAAGLLGLAYWTLGDLEAGHRFYTECMTRLVKIGHLSDAMGCAIALADIRIGQGRLQEAMSTFERALQLVSRQGPPVVRGTADMHVGLSVLFRERNDLHLATQHLHKCQELGEFAGLPQNAYRWRVALAHIREAEGDLAGSFALLQEAERVFFSDFSPVVRPISAMKAWVWVAQGRLGDALGWARERGLSIEDDLSYLREFEHITLARVLLAIAQFDHNDQSIAETMGFLGRLLIAAETGARTGSILEILVLQSLAHQMQGNTSTGLAPLERALTLAEPEGYIRLFVDEGRPMALLLERAAKQGIAANYARELLNTFQKPEDRTPVNPSWIEPLSDRERDVLRLLATELTGPEIAHELMVSLNTVRTHTKNIYDKLGVHNRQSALHRANELQLI